MRLWIHIQVAEMFFLRSVAGVSLRDKVRGSAICERLRVVVTAMPLCVKGSQVGWLGHLVKMPPGWLPREMLLASPAGRRLRGKLGTRWRDYISYRALEPWWICCPCHHILDKWLGWMDGWMEVKMTHSKNTHNNQTKSKAEKGF